MLMESVDAVFSSEVSPSANIHPTIPPMPKYKVKK